MGPAVPDELGEKLRTASGKFNLGLLGRFVLSVAGSRQRRRGMLLGLMLGVLMPLLSRRRWRRWRRLLEAVRRVTRRG